MTASGWFAEERVPDPYSEGQTRTEEWYDGRNYRLFSMLANVRNGYGFAGVDTGNGFKPIAEPRDWYQQTKCRGWVNGPQFEEWDRMKRWSPQPKSWNGGVSGRVVEHVSVQEMQRRIAEVKERLKDSGWKAQQDCLERRYGSTYCLIEWPVFYSEAAGTFYTQTMPRMVQLAATVGGPDNVRIVFGFDS